MNADRLAASLALLVSLLYAVGVALLVWLQVRAGVPADDVLFHTLYLALPASVLFWGFWALLEDSLA